MIVKKISASFTLFFPIFIGLLFFIGLFPGRLVKDTTGNIVAALTGNYTLIYPPFIDAFIRLLFFFDKSLAPLFFLQIFIYWLSICLLAKYLYTKNPCLSILMMFISVFPYNLHLHSTLIKDVWLLNAYLLFFGLIAYFLTKQKKTYIIVVFILLQGMIIALLRSNFIAVIPALSLGIAWVFLSPEYNKKYFIKIILLTTLLSIFIWGVNNIFQNILTEGRLKKVNHFTRLAAQDLLGMSIRSGHKGVTKSLSDKAKTKIHKNYFSTNVFWRRSLGDEAYKLRNKLRSSDKTLKLWKSQILSDPVLYLKHRWHVFSMLYDGTGQSPTTYLLINETNIPKGYKIMNTIKVDGIRPTVLWKIYSKYILKYFSVIKSHWWILIYSFIAFFYTLYRLIKYKDFNNCLIISTLIILSAWSYSLPYLFMLHHSEVRYVYPSNSLILFSIPFLSSYFISRSKNLQIERIPQIFNRIYSINKPPKNCSKPLKINKKLNVILAVTEDLPNVMKIHL